MKHSSDLSTVDTWGLDNFIYDQTRNNLPGGPCGNSRLFGVKREIHLRQLLSCEGDCSIDSLAVGTANRNIICVSRGIDSSGIPACVAISNHRPVDRVFRRRLHTVVERDIEVRGLQCSNHDRPVVL